MIYDDDAHYDDDARYDDLPDRRMGTCDCGGWGGLYGPCGDQDCRRCNPRGVALDEGEDH